MLNACSNDFEFVGGDEEMIYGEELEEAELVEDTSDENNLDRKRKANENYILKEIFETKCEFDQLWKESEMTKQFCIILW